ncbi:hypothetical protein [Helicobacter sp. MIT 99-5507]|uniref:hypothetical protein n=1 Tax=Helicobacter sp. MIT 99-5507 TaxID=152489 RepID=UPI000E1F9757|nr:hypothetical protein [Helicobacter sp. MIT 99-5507]RDU58588.1 hypothetical protein CQA42_02035 [Helicobacter sp. MIT 99-5507]
MNRFKKYIYSILSLISNDKVESNIKETLKKIYFILPFGIFAFLLIPRNIKNRMKLIFGLNYYYDLKGNDYESSNLDMKLSRISLWGGV